MSASVFARPSLVFVACTGAVGAAEGCEGAAKTGAVAGAVGAVGAVTATGGADGARAAVGLDPGLLVQASSSKPLAIGTVELDL